MSPSPLSRKPSPSPTPNRVGVLGGEGAVSSHIPPLPPARDLPCLIHSLIVLKKGKGLSQAPSARTPSPSATGGAVPLPGPTCAPPAPVCPHHANQEMRRRCREVFIGLGIRSYNLQQRQRWVGDGGGLSPTAAPSAPPAASTHVTSRNALFSTYFRRYFLLNLKEKEEERGLRIDPKSTPRTPPHPSKPPTHFARSRGSIRLRF